MPYWFQSKKLKVGKENDKRRKLTDEDRETIKELYKTGYSIREITRVISKVSRRAIQFILFPKRLERQYAYRKEKNWYYEREKHRKAVKSYRKHLKLIYGLSKK